MGKSKYPGTKIILNPVLKNEVKTIMSSQDRKNFSEVCEEALLLWIAKEESIR